MVRLSFPGALRDPRVLGGPMLAALGDSITARSGSGNYLWGGDSYHVLGAMLSGGRFQVHGYNGVSGNTTAQMLARAGDIAALSPRPAACLVLGGANDFGGGFSRAASAANLHAIYMALLNTGILPIAVTPTPKTGNESQAVQLGSWVVADAARLGIPCVDLRATLSVAATGGWISGYDLDGTHPTPASSQRMGQKVADTISALFPANTSRLAQINADPDNLIGNALFLTDTNADGIADGWQVWNGAATSTLVAGGGGDVGQWQQVAATTTTLTQIEYDPAMAVAPGDTLELALRLTTTLAATGSTLEIKLGTNDFTAIADIYNLATDLTGTVILRGPVPAGYTAVKVLLSLRGGTGGGTVKLAQATLRNLTALGLA